MSAQDPVWSNDYEAAALDDPDGDGFATWKEYWSGTDPLDVGSYLSIDSFSVGETNVYLEWRHKGVASGIPALGIERSATLESRFWELVGENAPLDGTNSWSGPRLQDGYYRLAVTNAP